jgi:hypothetical protein
VDALPGDTEAFGDQELPLEDLRAAEATEAAARGHDAMAGHRRVTALPHDVAHGARGARTARACRDVAVGHDPAGRDRANDRENARCKRLHRVTPAISGRR